MTAIAAQPDAVEALRQQLIAAQRLYNQGDIAAAVKLYRQIIAAHPDQPDACHRLGMIAVQRHQPALALQLFDQTLARVPLFATAHAQRAMALRMLGRTEEALLAAQKALEYDASCGEAWDMAGCLLRERGESHEAQIAHQHALAQQPANPAFYNNYAITLAKAGLYEPARAAAQKAVALQPDDPALLMTLGNILGESGHPQRAIDCYQRVQKSNPDHREAIQAEGRAHLALGALRRGWELLERRPAMTPCNQRLTGLPRWQGQAIRHLLMVAEQGYGDSLMFMRYLPLLKGRVERLSFVVPAPLQRLMRDNLPGMAILDPQAAWPEDIDAFDLLLSLPRRLDTDIDSIPAPVPYIRAWAKNESVTRLQTISSPRIGLVWSGNPANVMDHRRSMPFDRLRPVIERAAGHCVSLQKETAGKAVLPGGVCDAAPFLEDFAATAAWIAQLDLILSVDTAPAHLAAAMGKPVWLMLAFDADWRWMLERPDSPWYPSVRLFRQPAPGDWDTVIQCIMPKLQAFLQGDRPVWSTDKPAL